MAHVTVKHVKKLELDPQRIAKQLAPAILGAVLARVDAGVDTKDQPFAQYSTAYLERLAKMGEDGKVDLRVTGGLMNSLKHLRTEIVGAVITMYFGPDTGTSAAVAPPPTGKKRAKRTGERGPPHNVVGLWIHEGTTRMPPRPWLGMSPANEKTIAALLKKLGVFKP